MIRWEPPASIDEVVNNLLYAFRHPDEMLWAPRGYNKEVDGEISEENRAEKVIVYWTWFNTFSGEITPLQLQAVRWVYIRNYGRMSLKEAAKRIGVDEDRAETLAYSGLTHIASRIFDLLNNSQESC